MKKIILAVALLLIVAALQAQDSTAAVGDAGGMRSNEKIYVVVAVLVAILAGIFAYLIRLDRKITKLEKGTT